MSEQPEHAGFRWAVLLRPRWILCQVIAIAVLLRLVAAFIPTEIVVGPKTTRLSKPLRADGTVDYPAALDQQSSKYIDPEQNAVVELLKAFGTELGSTAAGDSYLSRLGIEQGPTSGPYFVSSYQFIEALGYKPDSEAELEAWRTFFDAEERPWTADEFPLVAQWVKNNEAPLRHILRATEKPAFYCPIRVDPHQPHLHTWNTEELQCCRAALRLLRTCAMLEVGEGDIDSAFACSLACHRLARLISQSPHSATLASAKSFCAVANHCDEAIIRSGRLQVDDIRHIRDELKLLPDFPDLTIRLDTAERFAFLDDVQAIHSGNWSIQLDFDVPKPGSFDPNIALREYNHRFDQIVDAFRLPDRPARMHAIDSIQRSVDSTEAVSQFHLVLGRIVGSPVPAGRRFAAEIIAQSFSDIQGLADVVDAVEARVRLVETAYAVAEYRAREARHPPTLEAMLRDYISEIPLDPFTGDPLKYVPADDGFVLYSVGPNGIDENGEWDGNADDIAFSAIPEANVDGVQPTY